MTRFFLSSRLHVSPFLSLGKRSLVRPELLAAMTEFASRRGDASHVGVGGNRLTPNPTIEFRVGECDNPNKQKHREPALFKNFLVRCGEGRMSTKLESAGNDVARRCQLDYDQFVEAYGPSLRSCARARIEQYRLHDELDPEDLVNIVFAAVLDQTERIESLKPLQLWVYLDRATEHRAHDVYRWKHRHKRDARRRAITPAELVVNVAVDALQECDCEFNESLTQAYECLTADERCIAMWRRAGYEWCLIAELLGRSEAAVRKQFERAICRVRRKMST